MNISVFKFLLSVVCFSAVVLSYGQEPFFCVSVGAKLDYVKRCPEGEVEGSSEMVILDVQRRVEGGDTVGTILYSFNMFDKKMEPESDLPVEMMVGFSSEAITMDMGKNMASMLRSMMGDDAVDEDEVIGEPIVFPYCVKPGDRLLDHSYSVKVKWITIMVSTTERRVLREEVITTEAGVFPCIVLEESVVVKSLGISRRSRVLTWCSRGVGTVRQEVYDRRGRLVSVEVLSSLGDT